MSESTNSLRMPVGFGKSTGPRLGPDGKQFLHDRRSTLGFVYRFRSDPALLRALTPREFTLAEDPVVTIAAAYMTNIEWLAGRGYAVLGVRWRVRYRGQRDRVDGEYMAVLWENKTDPIITGRDELGMAKIYAELPDPQVYGEVFVIRASWDNFCFFEMKVNQTEQLPLPLPAERAASFGEGLLHLKYVPSADIDRAPDVRCPTFTPYATPTGFDGETFDSAHAANMRCEFHKARWEDMPTQFGIVNALANLPVIEPVTGFTFRSTGAHDHSNRRTLA